LKRDTIFPGVGFGLTICLQPIYFSEISPDRFRGQINTMTGVLIETGYASGSVLALPWILGRVNLWPYLFYICLVPNILALLLLIFLPESPKFLMAKNAKKKSVVKSLEYFGHASIEVML